MKNWVLSFLLVSLSAFGTFDNQEMKEKMTQYLLPLDHPAKPFLDQIFSQGRVTKNMKTLRKAGFDVQDYMPRSLVVIARHPLVPGYVFKIYLDSERFGRDGVEGWRWLTRRCKIAKKTREIIRENRFQCITVADKWLYPLPPSKKAGHPVVLLATDMEILDTKASKLVWKTIADQRPLDELCILLKAGYGSSYLPGNIPYTRNGTFAIIDTEKPKRKHKLEAFGKYFSKEMKSCWEKIIK